MVASRSNPPKDRTKLEDVAANNHSVVVARRHRAVVAAVAANAIAAGFSKTAVAANAIAAGFSKTAVAANNVMPKIRAKVKVAAALPIAAISKLILNQTHKTNTRLARPTGRPAAKATDNVAEAGGRDAVEAVTMQCRHRLTGM